ncbi:hypothetical protein C0J52_15421 [Blattella germanica]|nr:hypothetical protein C0J52_15421 [Blattella germanica]
MAFKYEIVIIVCIFGSTFGLSGEISIYSDPSNCIDNEFFDIHLLKCVPCNEQKNLEPTKDSNKIVQLTGQFPECELCQENEMPTLDKRDCMLCSLPENKDNDTDICTPCNPYQIKVDRFYNGTLKEVFECLNCSGGTVASADGKTCETCLYNCSCSPSTHESIGGVCVPLNYLSSWPDEKNSFTIQYESGEKIDSYFFRKHLRLSVYLCKQKNQTACQIVANMCTMVMYRDDYMGSPCKLFQDWKHIPTSDSNILPWLYYGEGDAQTVLTRKKIPAKYSMDLNSKVTDRSQWQLTRRFFLIDKISGVPSPSEKSAPGRKIEEIPTFIRYLKSFILRVKVQSHEEEGRIYPPLLVLKYGEVNQQEIDENVEVSLSFKVAMGVLSAFAVVWSGIETWSWSRRSGRVGIDLVTLGQLMIFACGNLANVFFFVVACASFHTFSFYKGQSVIGIENWAVADPDLHTTPPAYMDNSPPNVVCRFAVGVCVYLSIYFAQWLFIVAIYERYIKNVIQEFEDICSVANISVFILELENFGYYIHGRSAHGFADTDMQTMLSQLQREEEDLCGHRGLLPGTDQQTFLMAIPMQLRSYYRKVMAPLSSRLSMAGAGGLRTKVLSGNMDRSIYAYHNMNKFLAAFLEHALKDLDYDVREKTFVESLLDIEFTEIFDKGVLYADTGHSFDNVLFYGNEFTLATFDIILFCFVEVLFHDFLLAAVVTAFCAKILVIVRRVGGRTNLAKKTLIDERFLV